MLRYLISRSTVDKEKYKVNLKYFRKISYQAEVDYYSNQFNHKLNSTKKLWQNLNSHFNFRGSNSSKQNSFSKLIVGGSAISDSFGMTEKFNKFFSSVGSRLANNLAVLIKS